MQAYRLERREGGVYEEGAQRAGRLEDMYGISQGVHEGSSMSRVLHEAKETVWTPDSENGWTESR